MGLNFSFSDGQTLLDEDERDGLKITTISTKKELDEFEQQNIEDAIQWSLSRTFIAQNLLSEDFIKILHQKMYHDVWTWAGEFRSTNKNIGVDKWQIPTALRSLMDDAKYWYRSNTYSAEEFTIRLKHRLVSIHCFANGNGRHSRLYADIIIKHIFNQPIFTWGANINNSDTDIRSIYLNTLKAADIGDMEPLIQFSRL
jgi:Fic-DOC domain mobile mystery protein B